MRKIFPGSLPAWLLILVVVVLAVSQVSTLVFASYLAADRSRTTDLFRLMQRTTGIMQVLASTPPDLQAQTVKSLSAGSFLASVDAAPAVMEVIAPDDEMAEFSDLLMARIAPLGAADLRIAEFEPSSETNTLLLSFRSSVGAGPVETDLSKLSNALRNTGQFAVSVELADKSWLNIRAPLSPEPPILDIENAGWYILLSAAILSICVWAIVQLTAPYRKLEHAVTVLGNNLNAEPLLEEGSNEVRSVIRAVNRMQDRLKEYVADREYLAAALAHDLRTPLTRMRIRCELPVSESGWRKFSSDVGEVEDIVASVLDYASFSAGNRLKQDVEMTSLVRSICDKTEGAVYRDGNSGPQTAVVAGDPPALRRCIGNLVDNAVTYGRGADVSVRSTAADVVVTVQDNGPGIAQSELKMVTRPFYRAEKSRSQNTGGVGLGLSIVEKIAHAHGGELVLSNRPEGGLTAELHLPRHG